MRASALFFGMLCAAAACGSSDPSAAPGGPDAGATADSDARPGDTAPDAATPVASCQDLPATTGDQVIDLESGGTTRQFRLHVPPSYDPTVPTPVVVNFHGYTSNASQQELLAGMSSKADAEGFIAVHPDGIDNSWNAGSCCGTAQETGVDDVGFVHDLLDYLESQLCVDRSRIYATGLSNGGFMSHRLACEMSDRIAAIAPVAGGNVMAACDPERPMPVMHFHGTADTVVEYLGATTSMNAWAARNGCAGEPEVVFDEGNTACESHPGCDGGAEVILCTITGFGHWWPGAVGAISSIDATDAMWEFFGRHRLPAD